MTRQRMVILEELKRVRSHPTADELYGMVRDRLPKVSLATIYRNLDMLAREGIIQKIDSLKVYRSRYLKDEIFKRPYTFIGMLLKVEKEGFNIARIKRVCAKDYNAIVKNRTGGGPDSENWPVHEWEIIPFERLWVYILKIIEYNELPEELRKNRKIIEDDFTMSQMGTKSNEIPSE